MGKKEELVEIVGSRNVIADAAVLDQLSGDESFVHSVLPALIVQPYDTDEVQQIVKWANKTRTPLVPISSGTPHFRGDSVPGVEGAIIMDLSSMDRILRVDRKNRVAMIEPGVTFEELCPELEKEGLRPNVPLLPRRRKSVVGSVLEREPVIMPKYHWDMVDPLACAEIIFGSGDIYRTGAAAGPGTLEEQWSSGGAQKSHAEPLADWCRVIQGAQGMMGIVTWATIRCERIASLEEPFMAGSNNLPALFELIHWLVRLRLADECLILNNTNLASILAAKRPDEFGRLRDSLPPWILVFCISGYEYYPEERVSYQTERMMEIAGHAGVKPVKELNGIGAKELLHTIRKPPEEPYWKTRLKGSCQDMFFLATYDRIPELIEVMNDTAEENDYPSADMGIYLQPVVQGTSYHCEFNLFYAPSDAGEVNNLRNLSRESVKHLINNGAFFSRPYGTWADTAYVKDAETVASLRKIKGILDPNNIMNPGKLCF